MTETKDYNGCAIEEFWYEEKSPQLAPEIVIVLNNGKQISILACVDQDGNPSFNIQDEHCE